MAVIGAVFLMLSAGIKLKKQFAKAKNEAEIQHL